MNTIKNKIKKTRKLPYKPLNKNLSEFRSNMDINYEDIITFLNNNPSKEKMNKLYDTTIYSAESDSIGEDWHYVREFTRQEFDILCKLIKFNVNIYDIYKQEENKKILEFKNKYKNRKNIDELLKIYIKKQTTPEIHYQIIYNYLFNNKILNNKELIYYKNINNRLSDYIYHAFDLLNHLRIL